MRNTPILFFQMVAFTFNPKLLAQRWVIVMPHTGQQQGMSTLPWLWSSNYLQTKVQNVCCSDMRTIWKCPKKLFLAGQTTFQIRGASVCLLLAYQLYQFATVSTNWTDNHRLTIFATLAYLSFLGENNKEKVILYILFLKYFYNYKITFLGLYSYIQKKKLRSHRKNFQNRIIITPPKMYRKFKYNFYLFFLKLEFYPSCLVGFYEFLICGWTITVCSPFRPGLSNRLVSMCTS